MAPRSGVMISHPPAVRAVTTGRPLASRLDQDQRAGLIARGKDKEVTRLHEPGDIAPVSDEVDAARQSPVRGPSGGRDYEKLRRLRRDADAAIAQGFKNGSRDSFVACGYRRRTGPSARRRGGRGNHAAPCPAEIPGDRRRCRSTRSYLREPQCSGARSTIFCDGATIFSAMENDCRSQRLLHRL